MDTYEYSELLKSLKNKVGNIASIIKPDELKTRLKAIEELENSPDFWQDAKNAASIGKEKTKLSNLLKNYENAFNALNDANELFELANAEEDHATLEALFEDSKSLEEHISQLEISMLLSDENDNKNAIISIHPGAGGTESNDWASMLYRMYLRFCEREGFKVETLDFQEGEEAGLKDASFLVKGINAYGYLKAENGIHRLVRTSPFDSAGRRHTSFCSVMVSPELDDDIEIEIAEKDIRVDYYRASGAGGQHINKTDSAVRITHFPSGIVVQCQNDRNQHKNKATAFKMLKSRLYELELMKQQDASQVGEKSEMGWGHQIRSYVLFPYQQVKDTRSNEAFSNVEAILDGDIKKLIEGVLIASK
ncbi:peptide chain release factor 2 [Campylobacter sp. MIT 12-8780]|uniref:peptide chain release factor 2 n=1 Tax=unclassified Campylobacter TaxID=2593542 RepID=UPI00115D4929|nr:MULTISPECIES: peptide chain release factor 2 [unclassified Campylobacter]NDJ26656.1 peptide chain release factor 2 [Campylobacter sp. MIT 19-121]TQR42515.1 peptide chain release factor 2 [Campylobacter sp. MIT 12-8780]